MKPSSLETKFSLLWMAVKGPRLESEALLIPGRKFRVDFVHRASKTVVEIEGGAWSGGRHTRGSGFIKDCEKYNELGFLGYQVFRLTNDQLNVPYAERLAQYIWLIP